MQGMADDDLVVTDQLAFFQHGLERGKPDLVVAHREIFGRLPILAREARHVDVPAAGHAHGEREREGAAFPFGVEYGLAQFRLDRPEAVHAAEILPAVHFGSSGRFGKPVPIMESRVTNSASLSSLQPSVPSGRIGMTR